MTDRIGSLSILLWELADLGGTRSKEAVRNGLIFLLAGFPRSSWLCLLRRGSQCSANNPRKK